MDIATLTFLLSLLGQQAFITNGADTCTGSVVSPGVAVLSCDDAQTLVEGGPLHVGERELAWDSATRLKSNRWAVTFTDGGSL